MNLSLCFAGGHSICSIFVCLLKLPAGETAKSQLLHKYEKDNRLKGSDDRGICFSLSSRGELASVPRQRTEDDEYLMLFSPSRLQMFPERGVAVSVSFYILFIYMDYILFQEKLQFHFSFWILEFVFTFYGYIFFLAMAGF